VISTFSPVYQFFGIHKKDEFGKTIPNEYLSGVTYSATLVLNKTGEITLKRETLRRDDGKPLSDDERNEVELRLVMMTNDDYWMDAPNLQVAV
jgi:hypothetical protein